MFNLEQILDDIPSASTDDLKHLQHDLQHILEQIKLETSKRNLDLKDYIEYIPNFCSDDVVLGAVWDECNKLGLPSISRKAESQWLSPINEPYIYNDTNPIHNAKDIGQFPAIQNLMGLINKIPNIQGPVDSCLILKYTSNSTALSSHADDEDIIDQSKPICNFSIGPTRTLEFFDKAKNKPVTEVRMENNSLTIMKPGTQDRMKHYVRKEIGAMASDIPSRIRYSMSFRALSKLSTGDSEFNNTDNIHSNTVHQQPPTDRVKRKICLIAGDSYAARLDNRLGRKVLDIENIAQGGAKISQVCQQLEGFSSSYKDVSVEKLIISVGTNDIRFCKEGVNHLKGPFKQLCVKIKELFPTTKVFFQSLLPLPIKHHFDWITNGNVLALNRIIFNECVFRKYYFIDAFSRFSIPMQSFSPHIRDDSLFETNGIHPNTNRGMGTLARLYIRALHCRFFNPRVFQ